MSIEVVIADEDQQSLAQGVVNEGDDNSMSAYSVILSNSIALVLVLRSSGMSVADPNTNRALPQAATRLLPPLALDAAIELIASCEISVRLRFIEA